MLGLGGRNLDGRVRGRILRQIRHRGGFGHHQFLLGDHLGTIRTFSDLWRIEDAFGLSQRRIGRNSRSIKGTSSCDAAIVPAYLGDLLG